MTDAFADLMAEDVELDVSEGDMSARATGPVGMDVGGDSADLGWSNGVGVCNGNLVPPRLGIPTATVPMGAMADTGMPVGLTFAGRAYSDTALLRWASALTAQRSRRPGPGAHRRPAYRRWHDGRQYSQGTRWP